jgi:hypothetical protein
MPTCKYCGKSGFFLSVSSDGLCTECLKVIKPILENNIRIINESIELIEKSNNYKTRLSRCDLILRISKSLLEYEKRNIPVIKPPPSKFISIYANKRDTIILESLKVDTDKAKAKFEMATSPNEKIKEIDKVLLKIQDYKKEINNVTHINKIETELNRIRNELQSGNGLKSLKKTSHIESRDRTLEQYQEIPDIIPNDIFELLWFPDGPYKNFNPKNNINRFEVDGIIIEFSYMGSIEPSLIPSNSKIMFPKETQNVPKLPYFPSYHTMTPEQRWVYLNWLRNIDSKIDIGYVFVFYYGLERHLFFGKYEEAFKMLLRLRGHHLNKSFINYSSNALIASCLVHNRADLFKEYIKSSQGINENKISCLYLLAKYGTGLSLSSDEIITLSRDVGFSNQRYIKSERDLFKQELNRLIQQKYSQPELSIITCPANKWPPIKETIMANYSIDPSQRFQDVPCLKGYQPFCKEVKGLLAEAHESTKKIIKNVRKKTKFFPERK